MKRRFPVLSLVLVVGVLAGCGGEAEPSSAGEYTAEVSDDGTFSLTAGVLQVQSTQAGTAEPGTIVEVATRSATRFSSLGEFVEFNSLAADISLSENAQPKHPIAVIVPAESLGLAKTDEGREPVVAVTAGRDGKPEVLQTSYDSVRDEVRVLMPHLSPLDFFKVDWEAFGKSITDGVSALAANKTGLEPACLEEPIVVDNVRYIASRAVADNGDRIDWVWPCLRADNGNIQLELQSNGNKFWTVRTEPDVGIGFTTGADSLSTAGSGMYDLYSDLTGARSTGTLPPGATLTFDFESSNPPEYASIYADPGLPIATSALYSALSVAQVFGIEPKDGLAKAPGVYDCVNSAIDTSQTGDKTALGSGLSMFRSIMDCGAAASTGPLAFMFGVFSNGATLVTGQLAGLFGELGDVNRGTIEITAETTRRPTATSVPDKFLGSWAGPIEQENTRPYSLQASISAGALGDQVGTITYPELNCSGIWTLRAASEGEITLSEKITSGRGNCIDTSITLVMRADGQLDYSFPDSGNGTGKGVLGR